MPEGPEVKIASDFYNNYFNSTEQLNFEILTEYYSNKYSEVFETITNNLGNKSKCFTVGKNLFIKLKNNYLFNFHLGMTGGWSQIKIKHCHFRIFSNSKELFFIDVRKFGKMKIISEQDFKIKFNRCYDPLNRTHNIKKHLNFLNKNVSPKKSLCSLLMDQKKFPGVGNYIKSEVLYASKLNPEEKWGNINNKLKLSLITNTKKVMQESYELGGAELKDFENPFHKSKFILQIYSKSHTKKNNPVTSIKTSDQRKSWFCPIEQKLI